MTIRPEEIEDPEQLELYVRLPEARSYTEEEIENLCLCNTDLQLENEGYIFKDWSVSDLRTCYEDFNSGDDYALISAFRLSCEMGIYPPLWVLNGLNERFTKWNDCNLKGEKRDLQDFFNTGGKTGFRDRCYQPVYDFLFTKYALFKFYWGLNDSDIFGMLEAISEIGIDVSESIKHTRLKFTERSIRKLHLEKDWKPRYDAVAKDWQERRPCLTPEEVENHLSWLPGSVQDTIAAEARRDPTRPRRTRKRRA